MKHIFSLAAGLAAVTLLASTPSFAGHKCQSGWVKKGKMCEPTQSVRINAKRYGSILDLGDGNRLSLRPRKNETGHQVMYKEYEDEIVLIVPYALFVEMGLEGKFNAPAEKYRR